LTQAIISAEKLSCERGYRVLFEGLQFSVYPGDILRITGANGSGKTSLLNILAGLSSQFEGQICFNAEPVKSVSYEYLSSLAYLSHEKGIKLGLSLLENLAWFASLYPCSVNDNAGFTAALDKVGLKRFRFQRAGELSQGQKQRLALARLLISKAHLWVLDEPFTAIDQDGVAVFERLLSEFVASGGAVIITTHQPLHVNGNYVELSLDDFKPMQALNAKADRT
jgi:heme exporter protein A